MTTILLDSNEATEAVGANLWRQLPPKCLVFLHGPLGVGKTTLVRGLLRAAGYTGAVKSPTYTLVEEYRLGERCLFHFDLYRLSDPEELEWMGIRDYLAQDGLCLIEWPEMGAGFLPEADLALFLSVHGKGRALTFCTKQPELKKL
ncbi:MAG: tRNA (adenosine(37)-N6)-threonylcarbamoyltransferase complex ATPase subunit type 1 TsaE [Gammaproteobacteria bacterium HGW-Gammaproteobacteria-3]|nr:MAG: tRNA (adenosine(37)-N6)-threonylcarbamoyltransferase complex ATPase subunit type 1 TsaE [Gammaproteobacteria bacterium HGW-Gammaproteobacteria-3]